MNKMIVLLTLLAAPLMSFAQTPTVSMEDTKIETKSFGPVAPGRDQYRSYDFGNVFVGSRRAVDFVITAYGPGPSVFQGLNVRGPGYDATTNCPRFLFPGQRCLVRAFFWPHQQGNYWGDMTVLFADSRLNVRLFGRAYYR